jgi:putative hydrolase of the HAD superfamily
MHNQIKVVAFDADDTLWVNEPYFQEIEREFCELLSDYLPANEVSGELFRTQMQNLHLYGYGIKCFVLCMIETAGRITGQTAHFSLINKIIRLGQALLEMPIELLDGVEELLGTLNGRYMLVVATKGDLLDQQRKLGKSGLQKHFHHIEIMSNKRTGDYEKLLRHLRCEPGHFLMLGNSIKSDVVPVLELDGYAAHIPFHTTWLHEQHETTPQHRNFVQLESIAEILRYLP